MRKFDLVIFDLDGTLIDNRVAIRLNFNNALRAHGFPVLEDKAIDAMIGTSLLEMFERVTGVPNPTHMVDKYRKGYRGTSHQGVVILDHVHDVLGILKNGGCRLAIATGKANDEAQRLLSRIGLGGFDITTGFTETLRTKPYPDMLFYILRSLDIRKEKTVLVGDTPVDVATARNAGIASIAVESGIPLGITTLEKLEAAKPTHIISTLAELPSLVFGP